MMTMHQKKWNNWILNHNCCLKGFALYLGSGYMYSYRFTESFDEKFRYFDSDHAFNAKTLLTMTLDADNKSLRCESADQNIDYKAGPLTKFAKENLEE